MGPDIEPNDNLLRNIKIDRIIDTEIVNLNIISIISRWIDKVNLIFEGIIFTIHDKCLIKV
jgi:hypothetical protein